MQTTVLESRAGLVDGLLFEIAKRIQLSPTNYRLAVERYQSISEYLDRDDSPLHGIITRLYPQGSMAIGSVITSKFENDEFDIDIIAEMGISTKTAPANILDTLFRALNGEKGSRYFGKIARCSRCVQVQYEGMHLDVTPAVLLAGKTPRTSQIFHANEKEPAHKHYAVTANPWGFAEWFKERMPESAMYVEDMAKRVTEPVPDTEPLNAKARPLVALQLLKRWRNKNYDQRQGRMPPSVMMARFVATNSGYRASLFDELATQAQYLHRFFSEHTDQGTLVEVENPACPGEDIFTDRWPGTLSAQRLFTDDLKVLTQSLMALSKDRSAENCHRIMAGLFGEKPTAMAMDELAKNYQTKTHSGGLYHNTKSAAVSVGASGLLSSTGTSGAHATLRNTFFGSD
jgi:hypothetical protein